jgi:hypothetical protein
MFQQQRVSEPAKKNRPVKNTDSLWDAKVAILNVLKEGPMCVSELAVTIGCTTAKVLEALEDMPNVVEKRRYSFLKKPELQMWGIARPFKSKKKNL